MGNHNTHIIIISNEARLTVEMYDIIISEGISFNLAQKPRFKKALDLATNVPKGYQPPNRNIIYKDLLVVIHYHNMESTLSLIKKESDFLDSYFLEMVLQLIQIHCQNNSFLKNPAVAVLGIFVAKDI